MLLLIKKLFGISVLGLLLIFNVEAASYVFKDSLYTDCDIITKKDPTTFQTLTYVEKKLIWSFDGRVRNSALKTGKGDVRQNEHFIFNAKFKKDNVISIRVNAEFKTKEKAEKQAIKYAKIFGQVPYFLKKNIFKVNIHKGNELWNYNNAITIHTRSSGTNGKLKKCAEEVMVHEAGHALAFPSWKTVQEADNKFISKYAKDFPYREDIAETVLWWIAMRCKEDRISKSNYKKISKAIPNRLKYFDKQNYDNYPLVCKNKLYGGK